MHNGATIAEPGGLRGNRRRRCSLVPNGIRIPPAVFVIVAVTVGGHIARYMYAAFCTKPVVRRHLHHQASRLLLVAARRAALAQGGRHHAVNESGQLTRIVYSAPTRQRQWASSGTSMGAWCEGGLAVGFVPPLHVSLPHGRCGRLVVGHDNLLLRRRFVTMSHQLHWREETGCFTTK
jgi:hypothetical protein